MASEIGPSYSVMYIWQLKSPGAVIVLNCSRVSFQRKVIGLLRDQCGSLSNIYRL